MKRDDLAKGINDSSRRIKIRGQYAVVPLKFDQEGRPATETTMVVKRLTLNDLRFLALWRETDFAEDVNVLAEKANLDIDRVERLIKKLSCFSQENARVKALCEIPTPNWIKAKHVESIYGGANEKLCDADQKSLSELAKIEGAYKNTSTVNMNVTHSLQLPSLSPEQEAELKRIGDSIATTAQEAA